MSNNRLIISDLHGGALEAPHVPASVLVTCDLIQNLIGARRDIFSVVINGDLIAGPYQRGDTDYTRAHLYPKNWEEIMQKDFEPLFTLLRETQVPVTYLMGNSERRVDMKQKALDRRFGTNIRWTQQTGQHALSLPGEQQCITHMNLGEPDMFTLKQSAIFELSPPSLRNMLYRHYGTKLRHNSMKAGSFIEMAATMSHPQAEMIVDQEAMDMDNIHQMNCNTNSHIDSIVSKIPYWIRLLFQSAKDKLVQHTLQQVYLRIIAQMPLGILEPRTICFGHIHNPFIFNRRQIQDMIGIDPPLGVEYIANSGTGVPLTAAHGGSDQSHVLFLKQGAPQLYRTYDINDPTKKPHRINHCGMAEEHCL